MSKKSLRNKLCICGSGEKFKNCCGKKRGRVILYADKGSLLHYAFLSKNKLPLEEWFRSYSFRLLNRTLFNVGIVYLETIKDPANFLSLHLQTIEKEISVLVGKYGVYELYFWVTRIKAENYFNVTHNTILLYREIMLLAIQKYGQRINNFGKSGAKRVTPDYLQNENPRDGNVSPAVAAILEDCYRLEILSYIYVYTTQIYRSVSKGASLVPDEIRGFSQGAPEDLQKLIALYDSRLNIISLSSTSGTWVGESGTSSRDNIAFYLVYNLNNAKVPLAGGKLRGNLVSNFIPNLLSLTEYKDFAELHSAEFFKYYGFNAEELFSFLEIMSLRELFLFRRDIERQYNLMQRGYYLFERNYFLKDLADFCEHLGKGSSGTVLKSYGKIFDCLTCTESSSATLDLWTRGPRKIFIKLVDDKYLLDYTGLHTFLRFVLHEITSVAGDAGNIKSKHFESSVCEQIKKAFGEGNYWIDGDLVNKVNSAKIEIDASFLLGDILFLVECKSVNVSFGFDRGDKAAIDFRTSKMAQGLREVEAKVSFVVQNQSSLNRPLPANAKYVTSIVVSPYHEYIWEMSDGLFLQENLPRIMTPEEILDLQKIDFKSLLSKEFVYPLN